MINSFWLQDSVQHWTQPWQRASSKPWRWTGAWRVAPPGSNQRKRGKVKTTRKRRRRRNRPRKVIRWTVCEKISSGVLCLIFGWLFVQHLLNQKRRIPPGSTGHPCQTEKWPMATPTWATGVIPGRLWTARTPRTESLCPTVTTQVRRLQHVTR